MPVQLSWDWTSLPSGTSGGNPLPLIMSWSDGRTRGGATVQDALPFLHEGRVTARIARRIRWTPRAITDDVVRYLALHRIKAESGRNQAHGSGADQIIGLAEDEGRPAGNRRLRPQPVSEWIFGG
jgi:hypothetical protein